MSPRQIPILALLALYAPTALAGEVLVAVASNFEAPLAAVADAFRARTGHQIRRSPGSSGKLYAQIVHGAPYEVFLSADVERPDRLLASGHAVAGSAVDYAEGALVLWSARADHGDCMQRLRSGSFDRLAIANPALAPYGAAARDWLVRERLWSGVSDRLVTGQNISQAFHFVATRNAGLGFAAGAHFDAEWRARAACIEPLPRDSHMPIRQRAVLLQPGATNPAARDFLAFLGSAEAGDAIAKFGYHR